MGEEKIFERMLRIDNIQSIFKLRWCRVSWQSIFLEVVNGLRQVDAPFIVVVAFLLFIQVF